MTPPTPAPVPAPPSGFGDAEFWGHVLSSVFLVLVAGGLISKASADNLLSLLVAALPAVLAIGGLVISWTHYGAGRVEVRVAHARALGMQELHATDVVPFNPTAWVPPATDGEDVPWGSSDDCKGQPEKPV